MPTKTGTKVASKKALPAVSLCLGPLPILKHAGMVWRGVLFPFCAFDLLVTLS
jgi:hypothetical protein